MGFNIQARQKVAILHFPGKDQFFYKVDFFCRFCDLVFLKS